MNRFADLGPVAGLPGVAGPGCAGALGHGRRRGAGQGQLVQRQRAGHALSEGAGGFIGSRLNWLVF